MADVDPNTAQNMAAEAESKPSVGDRDWIQITQQNFADSNTFLDANYRRRWARNLDLFHSRHPPGSKYLSTDYRQRSRIFRPKTRSSVRKNEAAIAAAFFSTADVVDIQPEDDSDPKQLANAQLQDQLLQYRLTRTIPWFQLVIGAGQDAQVMGVCASKQYWKYEEATFIEEAESTDEEGNPTTVEYEKQEVVHDKPCMELIPIEYLRMHPSADWIDPVQESPYLIHIIPMYVHEVQERAEREDPKTGQPEWKKLTESEISVGRVLEADADETHRRRQVNNQDRTTTDSSLKPFEVVYVFENHVRWGGEDWVYYSITDTALLSDPVPLREVYLQDERPFVIGMSVIEAHRNIPTGKVELTQHLQAEANDVANLRLDNVKLALGGKWVVQTGNETDLQALRRNTPGGTITTTDIDSLRWETPTDVTGSSFAEQDRINMDFDELAGSFSSSSVATNRSLNETVGGLQLLSGDANAVTELDLRVFSETWVKKVLRQLLKLEQVYETNDVILNVAARKAGILEKFQISEIDDDLMMKEVTLAVNVGVGAVDPMQKISKLKIAMEMVLPLLGETAQAKVNFEAVAQEVFGAAGYDDAMRFFNVEGDDMRIDQLMTIIENLMQALEKRDAEFQNKIEIAQISADADIEEQRLENQGRLDLEKLRGQLTIMQQGAARTGAAANEARARASTQGFEALKMGAQPYLEPFEMPDKKAA